MGEITLDELFRPARLAKLPDNTNILIRALSDAERRQKQLASLRASIRLDEKLADESSDEHAVYLSTLKKLSRDELLQILENWKRGNATEISFREIEPDYLPFPKDATDEDIKAVLKARDESEKNLEERRREFIRRQTADYVAKANAWTDDVLLKEAMARKRMLVSLEEVINEDMYQSIFMAVRNEDGSRHFEKIEDVRQLPSQLLVFLGGHQREVDAIDIWAVTKSGDGRTADGLVDDQQAPVTEPRGV